MKKKGLEKVDEEAIIQMMCDDVPSMRQKYQQTEREEVANKKTTASRGSAQTEPKIRSSARTLRNKEFAETFLVKEQLNSRSAIYIDHDVHNKMKRYLKVIAPGINISSYVNRIIKIHHETYIDTINGMYRHELEDYLRSTDEAR